jgi:hypothetical protein
MMHQSDFCCLGISGAPASLCVIKQLPLFEDARNEKGISEHINYHIKKLQNSHSYIWTFWLEEI